MTTLENTISILKGLPEPDLIRVQALAEKLFQRHEDKMADALQFTIFFLIPNI